jgi:pyruvate dehydrogenase E2 component (dihydrolipoamide acetyltransferase)
MTAIKISPTARRMADALGVDLATLTGTGPGGRVVKEDVEAAANGAPAAGAPAAPEPAAASAPQPLTSTQKVIARRMSESRSTVPDFELRATIDMERAVALRAGLKAAARTDEPVASFNDMVVRASALALRAHPGVNASYGEQGFVLHDRVNVGVAVAARGALLVPVIENADTATVSAIARRTRELAARAREGALAPDELEGGTFTVSNLGMFGVRSFSAVINLPQAAILAVGALERRPVVEGDAVVPRHVMDVALCCDHRILYGADAAAFLAELRLNLEVPERLL